MKIRLRPDGEKKSRSKGAKVRAATAGLTPAAIAARRMKTWEVLQGQGLAVSDYLCVDTDDTSLAYVSCVGILQCYLILRFGIISHNF